MVLGVRNKSPGTVGMRILVAMSHYFGTKPESQTRPPLGSQIEPIARIAACNTSIVALHRNFGPNRHTIEGAHLPRADEHCLDIVVLTVRGNELLDAVGLDPSYYSVEYFGGPPERLELDIPRILRDRIGGYDFYCFMEDDLIIHDPAFFAKLRWFQDHFGPRALLAPLRYEMSATGMPAKIVIDPLLPEKSLAPFRRPGQHERIAADWNGSTQSFHLPRNPHAASYFLTDEQLRHWVQQPTFADGDDSWGWPIESGATLGVGKVFDIYKAADPDPFFLELEHYGALYAVRHAPAGRKYGEAPLLAIAQNAVRALTGEPGAVVPADGALAQAASRWVAQGTSVGLLAELQKSAEQLRLWERRLAQETARADRLQEEIRSLTTERDRAAAPKE
jgi:hypothetical protein